MDLCKFSSEKRPRRIVSWFRLGFRFSFQWPIHGLVDPLCGTSWHKWNRYKLHRGIELVPWHRERPPSWVYDLCHGTRRGLFWPLLDPMEQVWYSQRACASGTNTTCSNMLVPLGQVVLVPPAQAQPVPICLCHRDKVGQWPILGSFLIKNQRGPNRISEIPYQKSLSNWSKIETKNRYFPTFSVVN